MPDYRGYAAFTRNHSQYLAHAADRHATNPELGIAFRSATSWLKARKAVLELGEIPIYFAVIDGPPLVEYEARLTEVLLVENASDQEIERLKSFSLEETFAEGLWESGKAKVKTLYLVKGCRNLPRPIPMTDLIKVDGGAPIHHNYTRAYSIVYDRKWRGANGAPVLFLDEAFSQDTYLEGACQHVYVNRYERSAKARARCIKEYGAICKACGFDFERAYGEIGRGFIHVHHKIPLSEIKADYTVDPVSDLVPICPNCYAMLHRGSGEAMQVEELRALMGKRASRTATPKQEGE